MPPVAAWVLAALPALSGPRVAEEPLSAVEETTPSVDVPDEYAVEDDPPFWSAHALAPAPGFAVSLEGQAGLAMVGMRGRQRAHGVVGGMLRLRCGYFQLGGSYEVTDSGESGALEEPEEEHWRAAGGFAGVFLPFRRWVDVDAVAGVMERIYANGDPIYGPAGFERSAPALTLRVGVSDRTTERTFGARVGAALVAAVDLRRDEVPWRRTYLLPGGELGETTGTTGVGGVSMGLVVSLGFEIAGGERDF